jgi:hypothetical protein
MKSVIYIGTELTLHLLAGELKPGFNMIQSDEVAEQLLAAGKLTGDFLPEDVARALPAVEATPAPNIEKRDRRPERRERE